MEQLLRRLVDQNDMLIELAKQQLQALKTLHNDLDGVQAMLMSHDSSSDVANISSDLRSIVGTADELGDKLDGIADKLDQMLDEG